MLLGLALIVVIALVVVLAPDGREVVIPTPVESVNPPNEATVLHQTDLEINMQPGYRVVVFVDGVPIPETEIDFAEPTGIYRWRPGTGMTFETWSPGIHTVQITWQKTTGVPEVGEYRWVFRVQ